MPLHMPPEMTLQPHQERVIAEKDELDDKIHKLLTFKKTETFAELSLEEQSRLSVQLQYMTGYSGILGLRIVAFSKS